MMNAFIGYSTKPCFHIFKKPFQTPSNTMFKTTCNLTYLNPGVITVPPIRTMFSANGFLVSIGHYRASRKKKLKSMP